MVCNDVGTSSHIARHLSDLLATPFVHRLDDATEEFRMDRVAVFGHYLYLFGPLAMFRA
jgi:hypothetical protein